MTTEEAITKLYMENENLKKKIAEANTVARSIRGCCVNIGRPLNDNCGGYTVEQFKDWHEILDHAEYIISVLEEEEND